MGATNHFADPNFDGNPVRIVFDPPLQGGDEDSDGVLPGEDGDDDRASSRVADPEPPFEAGNPPPIDGNLGDDEVIEPRRVPKLVVDDGSFFVVAEALQVPDTSTGRLVLTD